MNKENDKALDDLFRSKLKDPVHQVAYREEDWNAFEQMLHKQKKGIVYWLPVLSGVAALLLLFLGWWAFQPKAGHNNISNKLQAVNQQQPANTGLNTPAVKQQPASQKRAAALTVNYTPKRHHVSNYSANSNSVNLAAAHNASSDTSNHQNTLVSGQPREALVAVSNLKLTGQQTITANAVELVDVPKQLNPVMAASGQPEKEKIKIKTQAAFHPQYTLSVLASPNANGVSSFQQSKAGTNAGVLFSVGVTKKLTISTGTLYSVTPYVEDAASYPGYHVQYKSQVTPLNVTADCRMLDIPLNLDYQIYNKHQNKISVGSGLSSYIFLYQNYTFNYATPPATGQPSFNVPNIDKYFFGILNLSATFQHQLNSKVGISLQPYLKLPLTNIGYSQVRLQTTGVAVGLNWNLNSLSKL